MNVYVPQRTGLAALAELDRVDWERLGHAYGRGSRVRVTKLRDPATGQVFERRSATPRGGLQHMTTDVVEGVEEVGASACHHGTLYEATASVVPFLCAVVSDGSVPGRAAVMHLLLSIAMGVSFAPAEPLTVSVQSAFAASARLLATIADEDSAFARAAQLCLATGDVVPSEEAIDEARDALDAAARA